MRLLITGAWQNAKEHLEAIHGMGHETVFLQQEKDALPCDPEWVEGVICNNLFRHHKIEEFTNLRYIQLNSAGIDSMPLAYIREHGITLRNAPGVYSIPISEYVVGGVLQLYKQFPFFRNSQKQHAWIKHRGLLELSGKTVCIIGCGGIGQECAKRFQAFGCRTLGIATTELQQPFFDEVKTGEALDAILPQADVVVLTLPLTEQSYHLINKSRLAQMKPGGILVNVSRGGIVDTQALIEALKTGHLSGAVLDVFEEEPLGADSPLWDMENVIITPHNSFSGDGIAERLKDVIFKGLANQ